MDRVRTGPADADERALREQEIIAALCGSDPPPTMAELGRRMGLSRERVRQIVRHAEKRMGRKVPRATKPRKPRPARKPKPAYARRCTRCGVIAETPEDEARLFYARRRNGVVVGYRETCKDCGREATAEYYRANPHKQPKWRDWNSSKAKRRQGDKAHGVA